MRELDFMPNWYHAQRQRRQRRGRHYLLFGLVAALLAGWSFVLEHSVSTLQADNRQVQAALEESRQTMQDALELEILIEVLGKQAETLDVVTPRTPVSAVLAELSHCVEQRMVLSGIALKLEPIEGADAVAPSSPQAVRVGAARTQSPSPLPEAPRKMRITLTGIADSGAAVARLIDQLEKSPYFEAVLPGFSRTKELTGNTVTEFEIVCTVADYTIARQ